MRATVSALVLVTGLAAQAKIQWAPSLDAARRDGRPVILYFTFDT